MTIRTIEPEQQRAAKVVGFLYGVPQSGGRLDTCLHDAARYLRGHPRPVATLSRAYVRRLWRRNAREAPDSGCSGRQASKCRERLRQSSRIRAFGYLL